MIVVNFQVVELLRRDQTVLLKMLQLCYCEGKIFHFQQGVCVCARACMCACVCVHFGF